MPLAPIPLASQAYDLRSQPASAQRLLNFYAERMPDGSRSPYILKPAPGMLASYEIGSGPIRTMEVLPSLLYVLSGSDLWRLHGETGTVDFVGNVGTVAFDTTVDVCPTMAIGPAEIVVVNPPNAYVASHTGTLSQITTGTGNFPTDGASSVTWLDGYFIFTHFSGTYFFTSKLLTGVTFDSLDFAISTPRPDYVYRAVSHNGEVWLFGADSVAVWYNSGAADFPFRQRAGGRLIQGMGAPDSLDSIDGSLFWLANDRTIYRSQGYRAARISTHAIEEVLNRQEDLWHSNGFCFMFEGHAFYAFTLQTADGGRTFIYDCATSLWHERSSGADGVGKWRGHSAATAFGSINLIGDAETGRLYDMAASLGSEQGVPMYREAILPPILAHGPRLFMSRVEIEMEVGSPGAPGSVLLDWTDDGGYTYSTARTLSTGATFAYRTRVATNRCGSFRARSMRLRALGPATVYAIDADIQPGTT